MRQLSLLLLLLLLPVFSAIGMYGGLPSDDLTLTGLAWLFLASLVLLGLIIQGSPKIEWAVTRQVPLLALGTVLPLSIALAMLVSWLNLPAAKWLLMFIPATVGVVMLLLWLVATAFSNRDLSKLFITGFVLISVLLDWSAWIVVMQHGANV